MGAETWLEACNGPTNPATSEIPSELYPQIIEITIRVLPHKQTCEKYLLYHTQINPRIITPCFRMAHIRVAGGNNMLRKTY